MEEGCDGGVLALEGQRAQRVRTKRLLDQFGDGEFHVLGTIAVAMEMDIKCARQLCQRILHRGLFRTVGERRRAPPSQGGYAYRFVRGGKRINLDAFLAEVQPVLEEMDDIINGPRVDFSQQVVQLVFAKFRKVIDRVAR